MIHELKHTPNTMVGFRLSGFITNKEFDNVVAPAVYELIVRADTLNILFVVDESVVDFRFGAWLEYSLIRTHNSDKWNRAAIVTQLRVDSIVEKILPKVIHVESKLFVPAQFAEAVQWVSSLVTHSDELLFQQENDHRD